MKDLGKTIRQMEKANFGMQTEIFTMENGKKTRQTVMAFTFMSTEQNTKDNGKVICRMVTELNRGLMEAVTKATTKKA